MNEHTSKLIMFMKLPRSMMINLLKYFLATFSLINKWNWHLTQVVSYFLELCGIKYEFMDVGALSG